MLQSPRPPSMRKVELLISILFIGSMESLTKVQLNPLKKLLSLYKSTLSLKIANQLLFTNLLVLRPLGLYASND